MEGVFANLFPMPSNTHLLGGKVTIVSDTGGYVEVTVTDTGIGIKSEEILRILR